jgi:heat shock protein HspQ
VRFGAAFSWEKNRFVTSKANFSVGDLVHHSLFNYRGVVVDVDPEFMLSEAWYDTVAVSRPPKDEPWYRVLVHNATHETYVAERNLAPDSSGEPVVHPMVDFQFSGFKNGRYLSATKMN